MFDGSFTTYLDVRRFVEATFGPLDEQSEIQFLTYLGNVLRITWTDLRRDSFYYDTWTVTPIDDVYAMPPGVATLCGATGTTTPEGGDPVTKAYRLHEPGCRSAPTPGPCCVPTGVRWTCDGTVLLDATVSRTAFTPSDTPDTLTLTGYRRPDASFFTFDGESTCRSWKDIDLPEEYRSVFPKAVVGMMFFGCGDSVRGADWLNLANGEIASIQRATPGGVSGAAQRQKLYKAGSVPYLTAGCGCPTTLDLAA